MAKKVNKEEKHCVRHREDAEWLTLEICEYYKDQAKDIENRSISDNRFMSLCRELVERCDITEVQAINILSGLHIRDYVSIYEKMRDPGRISGTDVDKKEYLKWLEEKENSEKQLDDYDIPHED